MIIPNTHKVWCKLCGSVCIGRHVMGCQASYDADRWLKETPEQSRARLESKTTNQVKNEPIQKRKQ
jgi:hypothetical protein